MRKGKKEKNGENNCRHQKTIKNKAVSKCRTKE